MTETVQPVHKTTVELLPWYLNGRLSESEHAAVERHLSECLPCRAALRDEQRLRRLVLQHDDDAAGAGRGVAELLARIDGHRDRGTASWRRPPLVVGAGGVVLALLAAVLLPVMLAPHRAADSDSFSTLTLATESDATLIDVVFADDLSREEIEAIVASLDASIVAGPSELGRYTLRAPDVSRAEQDALIERLARDPNIRFAGRNYIEPPPSGAEAP